MAPSLVEVPIENNPEAFRFADTLYRGELDMVLFLTGVGTRYLGRVLEARDPAERLPEALRRLTVVARGPKPSAVLREWQVPVHIQVPEPNTFRELLAAVEGQRGERVAVQEYGRPNAQLIAGLQAQGRQVMSVPVYQWDLPEDIGPLEEAIDRLLGREFEAVLFTTGIQIDHLLRVAGRNGREDAVCEALRSLFVGSIGPTCSEALREHGITPRLEPSHPKMGILVREAALEFARHHANCN